MMRKLALLALCLVLAVALYSPILRAAEDWPLRAKVDALAEYHEQEQVWSAATYDSEKHLLVFYFRYVGRDTAWEISSCDLSGNTSRAILCMVDGRYIFGIADVTFTECEYCGMHIHFGEILLLEPVTEEQARLAAEAYFKMILHRPMRRSEAIRKAARGLFGKAAFLAPDLQANARTAQ